MNAPIAQPDFIEGAKERVDGLMKWRKHIESAMARNGTYLSYTEICQRVLAGNWLWFDTENSFAICEIITHAKGSYCHITVAGGSYDEMCIMEKEQIVPFLKSAGIKRITTLGRIGFLRRKRPDGWRPTKQQFFYKEI